MFFILRKGSVIFYSSIIGVFLSLIISMHLYYDSNVVSVFANTVIIDAGHGGEDGGAVGKNGTLEKNLNLEISKKLKSKLIENGFNVIMTREDDVMLSDPEEKKNKKRSDLNNRIKISREAENGIFLSIHMNYFDSPNEKGAQIFYSPNNEKSSVLAGFIEKELKTVNTDNKRVSKPSDNRIYIMKHIKIPALIIECGFISNREEEKLLKDSNYQDKIVAAVVNGIKKYIANS